MKKTIAAYLTPETTAQLCPYQINKIEMQINDYLEVNKASQNFIFERCPKCGEIHPKLIKSGTTGKGKQMYRCKSCNHRFVYDHGQLTFYSHQSQSKWNDLITDTQDGNSLQETAAKLDVHEITVFRMRHKYLYFIEQLENPIHP